MRSTVSRRVTIAMREDQRERAERVALEGVEVVGREPDQEGYRREGRVRRGKAARHDHQAIR